MANRKVSTSDFGPMQLGYVADRAGSLPGKESSIIGSPYLTPTANILAQHQGAYDNVRMW